MQRGRIYWRRQVMAVLALLVVAAATWAVNVAEEQPASLPVAVEQQYFGSSSALEELAKLAVKGRAPKTGYTRAQFSDGWGNIDGCSVREVILARDMTDERLSDTSCQVMSGVLNDPYTGTTIHFQRGAVTSREVQIDHVVALSDAWQKGAQQLSADERYALANDPLNLLAVDGSTNQQKGDGDAATWLPPNKAFRCQYVARQVAVKQKYKLWVTEAERETIQRILENCTR